jgi:hypothetical protein
MTTTTTTTTDGFVMRQGRRIAVTTTLYAAPTRKRKAFAAQWIKLPRHWLTALLKHKKREHVPLGHSDPAGGIRAHVSRRRDRPVNSYDGGNVSVL